MVIPSAVRSAVLQRLRLMKRVHRAVIMRASVIGQRFEVSLLTAICTCSVGEVRGALEWACRFSLIVPEQPEGRCYAFRHALTRDIVYGELLAERVRPFHGRIVRALERSVAADSVPLDALAYHSWASGETARASYYNELAGDRAVAMHGDGDARIFYSRAREAVPLDSPDCSRLCEKLRAIERRDGERR
ncbi:MAG: hypothetical protein ABI346_02255 [Candidatus Baltobacteraceae bacterium]